MEIRIDHAKVIANMILLLDLSELEALHSIIFDRMWDMKKEKKKLLEASIKASNGEIA